MTKIRVLILGASGYVGRHIVGAMAQQHWAESVAASRHGASLRLDATDAEALSRVAGEVDVIVNTVTGPPATIVNNARALQRALAEHPRMRLIYLSSMAAYGWTEGYIDETAPILGNLNPYSAAKAQAERLLADTMSQTLILRSGCIYGHGSPQWTMRIAKLLRSHRIGDLGALGDNATNLVHIDDVAKVMLTALRQPSLDGEAYNLADPHGPTWNEYFTYFGRLLGATPITRIGNRRIAMEVKLVAPALKGAELICRKLGVSPQRLPAMISPSLAKLWEQDIRLSSDKATARFGLAWTPWRDALRQEFPRRAQPGSER